MKHFGDNREYFPVNVLQSLHLFASSVQDLSNNALGEQGARLLKELMLTDKILENLVLESGSASLLALEIICLKHGSCRMSEIQCRRSCFFATVQANSLVTHEKFSISDCDFADTSAVHIGHMIEVQSRSHAAEPGLGEL